MARSLVLNATYEPLAVVPIRRAVVLVLDEKADVVHAAGERWSSQCRSVEIPSVIRLRYFVRVPFQRRAALSRRAVFMRDGHVCQYCARPAENIDHVVPRSRGGQHVWENVVACCTRCNTTKRDRLLSQTSMRLARPPMAPTRLSWVTVSVGSVPSDWEPYLALGAAAAGDCTMASIA
jgi:5-methylcytosine-specific restriction endonuclease McrA